MDLVEEVVQLRAAIRQIGERLAKTSEGVAILEEFGVRDEEYHYTDSYGNFDIERGWAFFGQFISGEEWLTKCHYEWLEKQKKEV